MWTEKKEIKFLTNTFNWDIGIWQTSLLIFTCFSGFHKEKLAIYARKEKQVAAKFVELLVSSNLGLKNLQSKFERTNENDLFSNIKTSLKQGLRADVLDSKSLDLIESCISATLEFLKLKQIPMRVKDEPRTIKSESHSDVSISPEHSSKKRYPSSQVPFIYYVSTIWGLLDPLPRTYFM